jgi:hypothetical protein
VPSFLSEPDPLIRAGLGPGPNSGLRAGLAGLVLIGHLYPRRPAKFGAGSRVSSVDVDRINL